MFIHTDLLQLVVEQHVVTIDPTVPATQPAELEHEATYAVIPAAVVPTN